MNNHIKYEFIENYAVIGNLHTIVLVSLNGSIEYLPFIQIGSPTVFFKLLDKIKACIFPFDLYEARKRKEER